MTPNINHPSQAFIFPSSVGSCANTQIITNKHCIEKSRFASRERISSRMRFFVSCSLNYHYSHKPMRLVLSYANVSVGFWTHSNKHLTLGVLYREEVIAGNGMKNHISLSWKRR